MAQLDATYHLRWNLNTFKAVAIYPTTDVRLRLISYVCVFVIFAFYISHLVLAVSVRNDMNRLPVTMGFVCGYFVSFYKWWRLISCRQKIYEVFDSLSKCLELGKQSDMSGEWSKALENSSKRSRILTGFWTSYIFYVALHGTLYPLFVNGMHIEIPDNNDSFHENHDIGHREQEKHLQGNITVLGIEDPSQNNSDGHVSRETNYMTLYFLPFGDWPFLDTSKSPAYELVYLLQGSGALIHGWVHTASDCFFLSFNTLVCGQFEALISTLPLVGKTGRYYEFSACLHHHQQILSTLEDFNTIYSPIMMIQFFNTMLSLCTFAFEATKMEGGGSKLWSQADFFLATLIQIYLFCIVGSKITHLSLLVADMSYESNWIEKPRSWKRSLQIMMVRAQKPLKLKGGPFYDISNETFLALIQLSFSYYTVLRNVQEADMPNE